MFAEGRERNRALGVWAAISAGGAAIGVLLGGVLTEYASWRWVLFVNVPSARAAVLAPRRCCPRAATSGPAASTSPGAVSVTAGLSRSSTRWSTPTTPAGARPRRSCSHRQPIMLLVAFVIIERRRATRSMPFSIFRLRTLRRGRTSSAC